MAPLKIAVAKNILLVLLTLICINVFPQSNPEAIYKSNIRTVRFHGYRNQQSLPIYRLNSGDKLLLDFDDTDADVKSYYYTFQICDYNWQPVDISTFDYLKGFTQIRIDDYRYSSIAYTKYTHYQAVLPDPSSVPTMSGNYLLKVFLDGDTSNLVFTRRLYVLDSKATIAGQVVPPFSTDGGNQRIKFVTNVGNINAFSAAQQVKVIMMQNYRWDNEQGINVSPTFIRGTNVLEYNSENNFVFPGGNEWRYADLQSFHLRGEHVDSIADKKTSTEIFLRTDGDRSAFKYTYYVDMNGLYSIKTFDNQNPSYISDYATVHFSFAPSNHIPYTDKDIYLWGQLTDYQLNDDTKMHFNQAKGVYETTAFLKQGYYNYGYLLVNKNDPTQTSMPDGNHFDTENNYTIFIYYRSFNDQTDELIGIATIDSRTDKPGVSF